jgi:hypothetical protein
MSDLANDGNKPEESTMVIYRNFDLFGKTMQSVKNGA